MAQKSKGFYEEHTVEVTIKGKKHRVNKYEADMLKDKLAANGKKPKTNK